MVKVGVTMPATFVDAGEFLADVRALEAAGAHLVGVEGDAPGQWALLAAIAAVTERVLVRVTGSEPDAVRALARTRAVVGSPAGEKWVESSVPGDRAGWTAMVQRLEAEGAAGVIVRWDPRLIDLLRNPDPDDRSDLQVASG